jgi:hypothetical protein
MTAKSRTDERRCRPVEQWPQRDRHRWQMALQAADLLEQGGCRGATLKLLKSGDGEGLRPVVGLARQQKLAR